jgi:hypothetical protein
MAVPRAVVPRLLLLVPRLANVASCARSIFCPVPTTQAMLRKTPRCRCRCFCVLRRVCSLLHLALCYTWL